MSYVNVQPVEDVTEARSLRRKEIARGWRFACDCSKCIEEAPKPSANGPAAEDDVKIDGPASKMDDAVERYETGDHVRPSQDNVPDVE